MIHLKSSKFLSAFALPVLVFPGCVSNPDPSQEVSYVQIQAARSPNIIKSINPVTPDLPRIDSGDIPTYLFHWTRSVKALENPKNYVELEANTSENTNENILEFKPAGVGFYAWSDPVTASTFGEILVSVPVKSHQMISYMGFAGKDPWAEINMLKGEGKDYLTELRNESKRKHDGIYFYWTGGTNFLGAHTIAFKNTNLLNLADAKVFDCRNSKPFASHIALKSSDLLNWNNVLKNYCDQMQFVREYRENSSYMKNSLGKLTDYGVIQAIYSEIVHELPEVKKGIENILSKSDANVKAPFCFSSLENSKSIGLLGNLETKMSCKMELKKTLEAGLESSPEGTLGRFGNDPQGKTYLFEAKLFLKEMGYLDSDLNIDDIDTLTSKVIEKWRKSAAATRAEELMSGLEVMKTELATRSLDRWTAPR